MHVNHLIRNLINHEVGEKNRKVREEAARSIAF